MSKVLGKEILRSSLKRSADDEGQKEIEEESTQSKNGRKKVKLENLILHLSIEENKEQEDDIVTPDDTLSNGILISNFCNPDSSKCNLLDESLTELPYFSKLFGTSKLDLDVARILHLYHERVYYFNNQIIRWFHPICVIIFHLHTWLLRNVNNFIRKYNKRNPTDKVPIFKTYERFETFLKLKQGHLKRDDLWNILLYENSIEQKVLAQRRSNNEKSGNASPELLEEDLGNTKYNYWDKSSENDLIMEDEYEDMIQ